MRKTLVKNENDIIQGRMQSFKEVTQRFKKINFH